MSAVAAGRGAAFWQSLVRPGRAVYLLGAEDRGLSAEELRHCDRVVTIEAVRQPMFNVSVAGSIVMYHRLHQRHLVTGDDGCAVRRPRRSRWTTAVAAVSVAAAVGTLGMVLRHWGAQS